MDVKQDELLEEETRLPIDEPLPQPQELAEESPVELPQPQEMQEADEPQEETQEERKDTQVEEEVAADFGFDAFEYATEENVGEEPEPVTLPFPADELTEDGKVKTVRKRMLKKLLKYEYRYLLPVLLCGAVLLQVFAVFCGIQMRSIDDGQIGWTVAVTLLYGYGNIGLLGMAIGMPETRYQKNFFKGEGYVTFSIPASAEEHILAKRISAIVCVLIADAAVILGGLIVGTIIGGGAFYEGIGQLFSLWGTAFSYHAGHAIFFTLEGVLLFLLGIPLIPCICGAVACIVQKFSDKKRFVVTLGVVFAFVFIVQMGTVLFITTGFYELFATPIGTHVALWLLILLIAGVIVLCVWYELRTIKYKLNLK